MPAGTGIWGLVSVQPGGTWVLAAAAVYLVGGFGVTAAFNMPLNNKLLAAHDKGAEWRSYRGPWTAWNHVRTIACVVAAALAAVSLV